MQHSAKYNGIKASDFEQLVLAQPGRNRGYTQLYSGKLSAQFTQAWLGKAQVFTERLNVGARIQASPPSSLLPFSFILPSSENVKYCHKPMESTAIAQATGGQWDVVYSKNLCYYSTAFDREYCYQSYQELIKEEVPASWLQSKMTTTLPKLGFEYAHLVAQTLAVLHKRPELVDNQSITNLMTSELFKALLAALSVDKVDSKLPKLKKRQVGVNNVIEYLQVHACELPDIQTLCRVANLSERSLQYGFMEALGITPIQYLRVVRLNGAKRTLQLANSKQSKVADIATDWGFLELGRFAKEYKQLFCELPSHTLNHC